MTEVKDFHCRNTFRDLRPQPVFIHNLNFSNLKAT